MLTTTASAPLGTCRVLVQIEHAAHLASDLGQTLRTLRSYQTDCQECALQCTCQTPGWNSSLDAALRDIAEEWGLI